MADSKASGLGQQRESGGTIQNDAFNDRGGRPRASRTNPLCLEIQMTKKVLRDLENELEEEKKKKRTAKELAKKEARTAAAKRRREQVELAVIAAKNSNEDTIDKNLILPPKKRKIATSSGSDVQANIPVKFVVRPGIKEPIQEGSTVFVPVNWSVTSESSSSSKDPLPALKSSGNSNVMNGETIGVSSTDSQANQRYSTDKMGKLSNKKSVPGNGKTALL